MPGQARQAFRQTRGGGDLDKGGGVMLEKPVLFGARARERPVFQPGSARVLGKGGKDGGSQLQAGIGGILQSGEDAKPLGVAFVAREIRALRGR